MTRTNKKTMITVLCLALTLFIALTAVSVFAIVPKDTAHATGGKTFALGAKFYYGDTITVSEDQYVLSAIFSGSTEKFEAGHDYLYESVHIQANYMASPPKFHPSSYFQCVDDLDSANDPACRVAG